MNIYSIYQAVNLITGDSYIGFASDWSSRQKQHKKDSKNIKNDEYFYRAIRKYGWGNFEWKILYQSLDGEHCLKVMENHFIVEHRTYTGFSDCKGYNVTLGGEGTLGYKHTQEAKDKCKISAIGNTRTRGLTNEKRKELGYKLITGKPKGTKEGKEAKKKKSQTRKGKTTVRDKFGNCFLVKCDDIRLKNGELVSVMKGVNLGRKASTECKNKISAKRIGVPPSNKGIKSLRCCCVVCHKEVDVGNLGRHHKHLPK